MTVETGCQPTTNLDFGDTAIDQTSLVVLVGHRSDVGPPAALELAIDGPDAADFTVMEWDSNCDDRPVLATGDVCLARIAFHPAALGPRTATLHLGVSEFPLAGNAIAVGTGVTLDHRNIDLASGVLSTGNLIELLLVNRSASPITVDGGSGTGAGLTFYTINGCPQPVTPGGACVVYASVTRSQTGCLAGTYTVATSGGDLTIPVTSIWLGGVEVTLRGPGPGRVTSNPPGIDCQVTDGWMTTCAHVFSEASVELIASGVGGSHFTGWESGCGHDERCTIATAVATPELRHGSTTAGFATADAHAVRVTYAGDGPGAVEVTLLRQRCDASCTLWLEPDTTPQLRATTSSRFGGWGGACLGTARTCDLGILVVDRDLTVSFDRDDRELQTWRTGEVPIRAASYGGSGELRVAAGSTVSALATDGTPVWTTVLDGIGTIVSLRGDPGGGVLVLAPAADLSTSRLIRLDAGGGVTWQVDAPPASSFTPASLAPLGDGGAAVLDDVDVTVFDGAGVVRRTIDLGGCGPQAVAAGAADQLAIACRGGAILRFDAAGAPLPSWQIPMPPASSNAAVDLAFDAQDHLVVSTIQEGFSSDQHLLARFDGAGAVTLTSADPLAYSTLRPSLAITSSGEVWSALPHSARFHHDYSGGALLRRFDDAGAVWTVDKPLVGEPGYASWDSVDVADATCDQAGHCALVGTYDLGGWVEVFSTP